MAKGIGNKLKLFSIREMFNDKRLEPKPTARVLIANSVFGTKTNRKRVKTDYGMTQSIYFAQKYSEDLDFTLAAAFGKPIVNAITSFIVGAVPKLQLTAETDTITLQSTPAQSLSYGEEKLNAWAKKYSYMLYSLIRNALRDGDSYILVEDPENPILIPPQEVTALLSEINGAFEGWQITRKIIIEAQTEFDYDKEYTLAFQYRKTAPFKRVIRYEEDNFEKGTVIYEDNGEVTEDGLPIFEERPLPIVHWANEKEPGMIYGNSEYRNVIYLMAKYSEVLEAAIINNRTASVPIPYVAGVGDIDRWMQANGGVKNDDGSWSIDLDGSQVVIAENHDFTIKVNDIPDTTEGAGRLLEIMFYLICQASETPEFLFGTAVKSSQASVETQMPIPIKKAKRKQAEFHGYLLETFKAVAYAMQQDPSFPINYNINAIWAAPADRDNQITVEVAQKLKDEGCITRKTYSEILGLEDFVDDIEAENAAAQDEKSEDMRQFDIYNTDTANQNNNGGGSGEEA